MNTNTFILGSVVMAAGWLVGSVIKVYRKTPWEKRFNLTLTRLFVLLSQDLIIVTGGKPRGSGGINWHRDEGRILGEEENKKTQKEVPVVV